jgi:predicted enzyme related to lactoylglutathione lyase
MSFTTSLITGVDFATVPSRDLARAMEFYGAKLGLRCSVHFEGRPFAEYETGNLTLGIIEPEKMGMEFAVNPNPLALHVGDVAAARAELEGKGVRFDGDIFDTGVCHMAFFADPHGNRLMLHHRYAPRVTQD